MIATTVGRTVDHVLLEEREKPESERTVFQIRTLSRKATAVIQDNLVGYDLTGSVLTSRPGTGALTAVKLGVAGWRNMTDADGAEVKPRFIIGKGAGGLKVLSPRSLDVLPQWAIDELGAAVMELNELNKGPVEEEDEEAATADGESEPDPTETSTTSTGSTSPAPSPPETPTRPTSESTTPGPVRLAGG